MSDVGRPSGLVKRGNAFYCRLRYPSDVVQKLGRAEFNRSLRTGLYSDALKRLSAARLEFDAEVIAARSANDGIRPSRPLLARNAAGAHVLAEDQARGLAQQHFQAQLHRLDLESLPSQSAEEWELVLREVQAEMSSLEEVDDPNSSRSTEAAEIILLNKHGLSADPSSEASRLLRAYLRRSMLQIARLRYARLHDDHTDQVTDRLFHGCGAGQSQVGQSRRAILSTSPYPVAMLDKTIIDGWAAEAKPKQKTIDAQRAVAQWFYDRTSRKPVSTITRQDVLAFKAKLVSEGQTPANIKTKLSRLRTLLQWAADNGFADDNVGRGVSIKAPRSDRKPFDLPALTAIFSSPIYSKGLRPTQGRGEAAFWLPLLALFTGARLEELGQLRPSDVVHLSFPNFDGHESATWFIKIVSAVDDEHSTQLKTVKSERSIPLHPELERLGFVTFVQNARTLQAGRIFHELSPGPYGKLTHKWGQWFSHYLRITCGITDRRMTFHSFRHTFADYARRPEIPESLQRSLLGHTGKDVHDFYGVGYSLFAHVEAMRAIKMPGLVLPDTVTPSQGCG